MPVLPQGHDPDDDRFLASTAMGAGACAIAAYDQERCDRLLGVDGTDEFTVYVCTHGIPMPA